MGFAKLPSEVCPCRKFHFLTAASKIFRESMSGRTSTGIHRQLPSQPAFATRAVPAWPGDTTSAGRLRARSSASAKATGKAEVRMFTSNCKSRAL